MKEEYPIIQDVFWEYRDFDYSKIRIFSEMMSNLNDVNIVISSSWRYGKDTAYFIELFETLGILCNVIDITPRFGYNTIRGNEIQHWLDTNKHIDIEDFIILDDECDMGHLTNNLVKTSWKKGIEENHINEILNRLK